MVLLLLVEMLLRLLLVRAGLGGLLPFRVLRLLMLAVAAEVLTKITQAEMLMPQAALVVAVKVDITELLEIMEAMVRMERAVLLILAEEGAVGLYHTDLVLQVLRVRVVRVS